MRRVDGYYHDQITCALVPFCAVACGCTAWMGGFPLTGIIAAVVICGAGGCRFGLICNPDLDQAGLSSAETRWIKTGVWGVTLMGLWIAFWGIYTRIIPYHRHWSSHAPIIGTVGRLSYLAFLPIVIIVATGHGTQALEWLWLWPYAAMFAASLAVADTGHWVRDVIESVGKAARK